MEEEQALIPGLPDDIALDCIARVPHRFLPGLRPICRRWRDLVTSPSFRHHRERIGSAEDLIFLVQALGGGATIAGDAKDPIKPSIAADLRPPVYSLSIYVATDGSWHRLSLPEPIPMFAQCVAVEGKLVLVGGWDPVTLDPVPDVRIVDLVTGEWRIGRPMATARSFFACAALGGRVYVAGGHDGLKNALRTAEVYDVEADEWAAIPAMVEERDESQGVVIEGRFWAVSGYGTERQGRFTDSAEWFDPEKGVWRSEEGVWSEEGGSAACFAGGERLWCVGRRGAKEYRGGSVWKEAVQPPEGMKGSTCAAMMGGGRVFVMGAAGEGGGVAGSSGGYCSWVLEIAGGQWIRTETPAIFSGFAYSAAAVRM
ncbi:F-box/kelch-repeat protein SKIP20 [Phalaenopsis equestris]|uniref:F-box/kelch-repeat protein SKIP20 n=1 Tax=Phalaenopsis equestris TaxID=78828 RepID=UPI0009E49300|nr:F-box/kelch-repeat protein SKIP20 [Phalaenopsis equestris]